MIVPQERIIVRIGGWSPTEVSGVPPGTVVEVQDYDVAGADEAELHLDDGGAQYTVSRWLHIDTVRPRGTE